MSETRETVINAFRLRISRSRPVKEQIPNTIRTSRIDFKMSNFYLPLTVTIENHGHFSCGNVVQKTFQKHNKLRNRYEFGLSDDSWSRIRFSKTNMKWFWNEIIIEGKIDFRADTWGVFRSFQSVKRTHGKKPMACRVGDNDATPCVTVVRFVPVSGRVRIPSGKRRTANCCHAIYYIYILASASLFHGQN